MPRRTYRRFLIRSTVALLFLGATLCGRFLYSLHAANAAMQTVFLPPHIAPPSGASVLVVAAHCDDETLGVGGMIADASRRGCQVSVVFVTSGDGFPMAVSREYRKLPLWKADRELDGIMVVAGWTNEEVLAFWSHPATRAALTRLDRG